jgi:hypothetical protein
MDVFRLGITHQILFLKKNLHMFQLGMTTTHSFFGWNLLQLKMTNMVLVVD